MLERHIGRLYGIWMEFYYVIWRVVAHSVGLFVSKTMVLETYLVVIDYFSVKTCPLAIHRRYVFYGCDTQGVPMHFSGLFVLSRDVRGN